MSLRAPVLGIEQVARRPALIAGNLARLGAAVLAALTAAGVFRVARRTGRVRAALGPITGLTRLEAVGTAIVARAIAPARALIRATPATLMTRPRRFCRHLEGGVVAPVLLRDGLACQTFDPAQEIALLGVAQGDCTSGRSCTGRPADAVDVRLGDLGQLEVHDMRHVGNVEAPGRDIRSDEHAGRPGAEILERHEILRATFTHSDGPPRQVIAASARLDLPVVDLSDNETGCCPRFHPGPWDQQQLHFENKPFAAPVWAC